MVGKAERDFLVSPELMNMLACATCFIDGSVPKGTIPVVGADMTPRRLTFTVHAQPAVICDVDAS